ncbi:MAG: proline dehydrogenase family protein [Acidobacteriia bacterium]|nr:proline dehydrogenase family protein [Terriglobia bacterium]
MMRGAFLFLSRQPALRRWMEAWPPSHKVTRRFVAGDTLEEALAVCARLQGERVFSTLDHLGENVRTIEEAAASCDAYVSALEQIAARGLSSTIAIKLTQFGLDLSAQACLENVRRLEAKAKTAGSRVEIDMESSAYTERTLALAIQAGSECGCVRVCVQAYLHRSAGDIERLNVAAVPVRLVKGAYREPPSVAFPRKQDVDANYVALMKNLLDHGVYPAIATHDEKLIQEAIEYVQGRGIRQDSFEFQMLYGIRRDLQRRLIEQGYRLRLYIPYGTDWYPYFMRRLAERPANLWFVLKNLLK